MLEKVLRSIYSLFGWPYEQNIEIKNPNAVPMPTSTPTPTPQLSEQYQIGNIPVESGYSQPSKELQDMIMRQFDPYNEATSAARVLTHPMASTNLPNEKSRGVNTGPNVGENPLFQTKLDTPNSDGSIDRGLYRINSNTFADFMRRNPDLLLQNGISSWNDMLDPIKNMTMARIIMQGQGYKAFYAAPRDLRARSFGEGR